MVRSLQDCSTSEVQGCRLEMLLWHLEQERLILRLPGLICDEGLTLGKPVCTLNWNILLTLYLICTLAGLMCEEGLTLGNPVCALTWNILQT